MVLLSSPKALIIMESAFLSIFGLTKRGCFELRLTKLGHVQRGGAPGAFDRLLATRFGVAAVEKLSAGRYGVMVGLIKDEVCTRPFSGVISNKKQLDLRLLNTARMLAR